MRRAFTVACLAVVIAPTAFGAAGSYPQSIAELTVNGQPNGPTLVVRRDPDGALLLSESALAQLRLKTPTVGAVAIDGQRYYRIDGALGADVATDDATQSIRLTLP